MFKWLKNFDKVSDEPEVVEKPTTVFSVEDQKKLELIDKLVGGLKFNPAITTERKSVVVSSMDWQTHTWTHNSVEIKLEIIRDRSPWPPYTTSNLKVGGEPLISLPRDNKLVAAVNEIKDREYNLEQENRAIQRTQVLDEKIALLDGVNNE